MVSFIYSPNWITEEEKKDHDESDIIIVWHGKNPVVSLASFIICNLTVINV